jgi:glycosyltransferase involved in cell wall biosynthesis
LDNERVKVIPHQVKSLAAVILEKNTTDTITIGILGAINYAKGAQIIKHLVQTIDRDNLNIKVVVIGEITELIRSPKFTSTGRYERDDLPNIIRNHHIDIFLIPSVWPETFSYTTQEVMMMEIPLMVFNLGAPAERVNNYAQGYVIDETSTDAILRMVQKFKIQKS